MILKLLSKIFGWRMATAQPITHQQRLFAAQQAVFAAVFPQAIGRHPAWRDPKNRALPPAVIDQAKVLLEHGNGEQQALAHIALKDHAEADRIIQNLKYARKPTQDPAPDLFWLSTLEGINWYNAGDFIQASSSFESALILRPNDLQALSNWTLFGGCPTRGTTIEYLDEMCALLAGAFAMAAPQATDWAKFQNERGLALSAQGEHTKGALGDQLLGVAVAAFRAALQVRTHETLPLEWAATQMNLGTTLVCLSSRIEGVESNQLLGEAVAAFRAATEGFTREAQPQDWADAQRSLGVALRAQSERTAGEAGTQFLAEAVAVFRAATEGFTPEDFSHSKSNIVSLLAEAEAALENRTGRK